MEKGSGRSGTAPAPSLSLRLGPCGEFVEPGAAMLFDEGQCLVEHIEQGRATHFPAVTLLRHQSGRDDAAQMEGKGGGGCTEPGLNFADGEAIGPGQEKETDDFEAGGIPEFGQSPRGGI
jgi:hypothetical protein